MEGQKKYWEIVYHRKSDRNVRKTTVISANSEAEARDALRERWRQTMVERILEIETIRELDILSYLVLKMEKIDRKTETLGSIYGIVLFLAAVTVISIIIAIIALL